MAKRIDKLTPGTAVVLGFVSRSGHVDTEDAVFLNIDGEGESRRAWFRQQPKQGSPFTWSAYRFQGGWKYGSSAETLRLMEVKES